jgi:hypothetical protein
MFKPSKFSHPGGNAYGAMVRGSNPCASSSLTVAQKADCNRISKKKRPTSAEKARMAKYRSIAARAGGLPGLSSASTGLPGLGSRRPGTGSGGSSSSPSRAFTVFSASTPGSATTTAGATGASMSYPTSGSALASDSATSSEFVADQEYAEEESPEEGSGIAKKAIVGAGVIGTAALLYMKYR